MTGHKARESLLISGYLEVIAQGGERYWVYREYFTLDFERLRLATEKSYSVWPSSSAAFVPAM